MINIALFTGAIFVCASIVFACMTVLRISDILKLQWSDFEIGPRRIHYRIRTTPGSLCLQNHSHPLGSPHPGNRRDTH